MTVWLIRGTTSGIGAAMMEQFAARDDTNQRFSEKKIGQHLSPRSRHHRASRRDQTPDREAIQAYGHIDVVISNSGFSVPCSIEEADAAFEKKLFHTNLFGAMNVVKAFLPHFRERRAGTFGFIGAGLGWLSYPLLGHYGIAKAGLTLFAESLQKETAHLGIKVVVFEVGAFETGMGTIRTADGEGFANLPTNPDYREVAENAFGRFFSDVLTNRPSDTQKLPEAVWHVVKGEGMAVGRPFPIRVPLGADALAITRQKCEEQLQLCKEWETPACSTTKDDFDYVMSQDLFDRLSIVKMLE
ncbi:hypothetical protein BDP55DRAFT_705193 [Colletotrichum godetiae]|uniref:Uncharacterized protein n=1 Tax=Colletotrichum godetiae TaxID=1209918 RepID=A0AAJ0AIM8_9PEZI|nr:uncharacterized protein BDP55DRAFT_705193 [Colletotrichum godetiae]KAK1673934.1 hypothetical protein BDP55DRAFT_705193 [Colletotrichum godetiae]